MRALFHAILAASLSAVGGAAEPVIELRRVEGQAFSSPRRLTPLGDALVFEASAWASGGMLSVPSVWVTDGTTAGTRRLLFPGTHENFGHRLVGVAGRRIFVQAVSSGRRDGQEVHAQDVETGASERILRGFASWPTASNDELFFAKFSPPGMGLYRSDGTARGTRVLRPGPVQGSFLGLADGLLYEAPTSGGGGVFFAKAKGTKLLTTLPTVTGIFFTRVGARAFFHSGSGGPDALWSTDGTPEGTALVASPNPASLQGIYPCLGRALLLNSRVPGANEAWASDGTPLGTAPFATLPQISYPPFAVADTGAICMFIVGGSEPPGGLWKTDLTPEGTQRVTGVYLSLIQEAATGGSKRAFFSAFDGDDGAEPWISDGTPEGTHELADLLPGSLGSEPAEFTTVGPRVFWSAMNEDFDRDLWMAETEPTLSIEDAQVVEAGRPVPLLFKVRLSHRSTERVTVDYSTAGDSADEGLDFLSAAGSLRFRPGETLKTVRVMVLADGVSEAREQFAVRLTSPDNADLGRDEARGTIEPRSGLPGPR